MNLPPTTVPDDIAQSQHSGSVASASISANQITSALLSNIGLLAKVVVLRLPEQIISATTRQGQPSTLGSIQTINLATTQNQPPQANADLRLVQTQTTQGSAALLVQLATSQQSFSLPPSAANNLVQQLSPSIISNISNHTQIQLRLPPAPANTNITATLTIVPHNSGRAAIPAPITTEVTLPQDTVTAITQSRLQPAQAASRQLPLNYIVTIQAPASNAPKVTLTPVATPTADGNATATSQSVPDGYEQNPLQAPIQKAKTAPPQGVNLANNSVPITQKIVEAVLAKGVSIDQLPKKVAAPLQSVPTAPQVTSEKVFPTQLTLQGNKAQVQQTSVNVIGVNPRPSATPLLTSLPPLAPPLKLALADVIETTITRTQNVALDTSTQKSNPAANLGASTVVATSTQAVVKTPDQSSRTTAPNNLASPTNTATGEATATVVSENSNPDKLPETLLLQVRQYAKQMLVQSGSTTQALQNILAGLGEAKQQPEKSTQQLARSLIEAIKPQANLTENLSDTTVNSDNEGTSSVPKDTQTAAANTALIRALITSPPLTTIGAITNSTPSNFINGLVTVLQLSLATRAIRQQGQLADTVSTLSRVLPKSINGQTIQAKTLNDWSNIESKYQLENSTKTLLSNIQNSKLQHTESRSIGQENLHLVLPISQHDNKAPELLIQREEEKSGDRDNKPAHGRQWNLTMKLDVGDLGEMLVKTAVRAEDIDIDIYTSSDALMSKVYDTLPFLKRRLAALGVGVNSSSCQRGKIPATLSDRPYQIFETQV